MQCQDQEDQILSSKGSAAHCIPYHIRDRIAQFRYIKIQPKTIDLNTRLREINPIKLCSYSPEPRAEAEFLYIKTSKNVSEAFCSEIT